MHSRPKIAWLAVIALLVGGAMPGQATEHDGRSPAPCGELDTQETGVQGGTPPAGGANCGLSLVAELAGGGAVQGHAHCAYVRSGGNIRVIDVSDPANPTHVGTLPTFGSSESLRALAIGERAVLVSGRGVYDISNCENPVMKGEIEFPMTHFFGAPHDIGISRTGNKVYSSLYVTEADITNLDDPSTWTVRDHTCDIAAQEGHPLHSTTIEAGVNLCDHGWGWGPAYSHGPADNADASRLYVGMATSNPTFRVIDMTEDPPRLLDSITGPGHSVDWFRIAETNREYVLHAAEGGEGTGLANVVAGDRGDTCEDPDTRPSGLGWAYQAFVTEVTNDNLTPVSRLELAINTPEFCDESRTPAISQTSIDNHHDASFAMVNFGSAGLRVFDIRDPHVAGGPQEVAYFNRGSLVHSGVAHYDASRGLVYMPTGDAFRVLEIQPQVFDALGLPYPDDEDYPQYPDGRPATP